MDSIEGRDSGRDDPRAKSREIAPPRRGRRPLFSPPPPPPFPPLPAPAGPAATPPRRLAGGGASRVQNSELQSPELRAPFPVHPHYIHTCLHVFRFFSFTLFV